MLRYTGILLQDLLFRYQHDCSSATLAIIATVTSDENQPLVLIFLKALQHGKHNFIQLVFSQKNVQQQKCELKTLRDPGLKVNGWKSKFCSLICFQGYLVLSVLRRCQEKKHRVLGSPIQVFKFKAKNPHESSLSRCIWFGHDTCLANLRKTSGIDVGHEGASQDANNSYPLSQF